MIDFACATSGQQADALRVWRTARTALGNPPSKARIDRVRSKLADTAASLLVGHDGELVVAMALAEPYREGLGSGAVRPQTGHVSMVFVDPERWGRGVGSQLLDALHLEMRARDWKTSSLWTRSDNTRARRLYEGRGYILTEDVTHLGGQEIVRYELQIEDGF
jgi:ribosomal protein S18 acetylase RimI-like enzyme